MQLDGYRVDTYPYNDKDGMAKWQKRLQMNIQISIL